MVIPYQLGTDIQVIDIDASHGTSVTVDVYYSDGNGHLEDEGG